MDKYKIDLQKMRFIYIYIYKISKPKSIFPLKFYF